MHKNCLTKKQSALLPLLKLFSRDFGLVGGTAVALQLGHRRSIDFDLFSNTEFDNWQLKKKLAIGGYKIQRVFFDQTGEYSVLIDSVKITFLYYPFKIQFSKKFLDIIKLPNLLTLAAMKTYALGRRAKWKDYVDLYFIINKYHGIERIIKKTKSIFGKEFNEKIFRAQLSYFEDIDFSEKINYIKGYKIKDSEIKQKLVKFSLAKWLKKYGK